jgi:hypothetical protein
MPVSHFTWQLLRTLVRNKNRPLTGRQLRLIPNRKTKDGTFLDVLVKEGLLEVAGVNDPAPKAHAAAVEPPVQFRTLYRLTERGKHAAEYGTYECEPVRPIKRGGRGAGRG